jgi:hypothetical protein
MPTDSTAPQEVTPLDDGWIFSPSQLETWSQCQRLWAFTYMLGIRTSSVATEFGTRCHTALEQVARGQPVTAFADPEVSKTLESAWEFLPDLPNPHWEAEGDIAYQLGPYRIRGRLDLKRVSDTQQPYKVPAMATRDKARSGGSLFELIDLKTTSGLQWAKTADYLANQDIQALLYGEALRQKEPYRVAIQCRWLYAVKKKRLSHPVDFTMHFGARHFERLAEVVQTCHDIKQAARVHGTLPLAYRPNLSHCNAYRGCPHVGKCAAAPDTNVLDVFKNALYSTQTLGENQPWKTFAPTSLPRAVSIRAAVSSKRLTALRYRTTSSLWAKSTCHKLGSWT